MRTILFSFFLILSFSACTNDRRTESIGSTSTAGYPENVSKIILNKCATSGCHNDISRAGASGLSLASWNKMFEGNNSGAVVIPYRPDQSTLFGFVNTYHELGLMLIPTMPLNVPALTREEVLTLKNWISQGAPDNKGFIKFSDNPERKKVYITNQGCDLVDVIDSQTGLLMRAVDVGANPNAIESPHMIKVSPDGQFWYVVFTNGNVIQKYRTSDDTFAGEALLGSGSWNTVFISSDSKRAFTVDWSSNGKIAWIDLATMKVERTYQGSGLFNNPHGIIVNKSLTKMYVTAQTGNYIYKVNIQDPDFPEVTQIVMQPGQPENNSSTLDPHEIIFSPNESHYFVSCQKSNEVRIFNSSDDALIGVIPTGIFPQELAISSSSNYLFVTCTEDTINVPFGTKGSVVVIDYQNKTFVQKITGFYQPHGVGVDDTKGVVYVASRNISVNGPAPHHTSLCGGRNGFLKKLDLNTFNFISGYKPELSVDPYSIAVKN